MLANRFIIRNLDGDILREYFLVSAVISIIAIRTFLEVSNYPQIGTGNFHIAHMIWGGFSMMSAILIFISFLNKAAASTAAIIGGIGFGTFIDELGKFITKDNNYFYEPTIAIIYVIFIMLYLLARFIPSYRKVTDKEYLVNALEVIKEAVINDLDRNEKAQAKKYLRQSDQNDQLTVALLSLLNKFELIPPPRRHLIGRIREFGRELYVLLIRSQILLNIIVLALVIQAGSTLAFSFQVFLERPQLPFYEVGKIISSLISVIFVMLGIFNFRTSRITAFRYFKFAVLVSIFLTQFFVFYEAQFSAIFNLIINILVLLAIEYAIFEEQERSTTLKAHS